MRLTQRALSAAVGSIQAARLLQGKTNVAILVGREACEAREEVLQVADRLAAADDLPETGMPFHLMPLAGAPDHLCKRIQTSRVSD